MADNGQSSSSSGTSKEKKRPAEIDRARIVEQDGEYGYFKNDKLPRSAISFWGVKESSKKMEMLLASC